MPQEEVTETAINAVETFLDSKKGKKNPSKADRAEFTVLWGSAIRESGLPKAMPLLCKGFVYAGAEPLYEYLKQEGTSEKEYQRIRSYPFVKDSKNEIELRIYLNLLSFELHEPTSAKTVLLLVKRITSAAYSKEGILSGKLPAYVYKLLVQPLAGRGISANVTKTISAMEAKSFLAVVGPSLSSNVESGSRTAKERRAAKEILDWCESFIDKEPKVEEDAQIVVPPEEAPKHIAQKAQSTQAEIEADQAIAFIKSQQRRIETGKAALSCAESEIRRLKDDKARLAAKVAELDGLLERSKESAAKLSTELEAEKIRVMNLEAEVEAAKEFADVVDRKAAKESDEAITRISRKLKIEYQDYQDAVEMDMDADLGENMRLQLQSVFRILKENGFDL